VYNLAVSTRLPTMIATSGDGLRVLRAVGHTRTQAPQAAAGAALREGRKTRDHAGAARVFEACNAVPCSPGNAAGVFCCLLRFSLRWPS